MATEKNVTVFDEDLLRELNDDMAEQVIIKTFTIKTRIDDPMNHFNRDVNPITASCENAMSLSARRSSAL
jgi:hypothetical protein